MNDAATLSASESPSAQEDFLPLNGTDYIEYYVGNAKQAAHFYRSAYGFRLVGYAGPETGGGAPLPWPDPGQDSAGNDLRDASGHRHR